MPPIREYIGFAAHCNFVQTEDGPMPIEIALATLWERSTTVLTETRNKTFSSLWPTRHEHEYAWKCPEYEELPTPDQPLLNGVRDSSGRRRLERHVNILRYRNCPRDTSTVFTLPYNNQCAPFTAQNMTVRESTLHGAPFTAQNKTLRRRKVTAHLSLIKTIHDAGANTAHLSLIKQYTTQAGYRDDDQTIKKNYRFDTTRGRIEIRTPPLIPLVNRLGDPSRTSTLFVLENSSRATSQTKPWSMCPPSRFQLFQHERISIVGVPLEMEKGAFCYTCGITYFVPI
ncbi:hypothetical protein CEXT_716441 [Caerostris extrusa]|uniref:Uncharacterized protein n=1 Tax=Caerostris extrusa TaxID=172846 RepID=A0AAV4STW4_CAEEX|nr:hypothetical protein CEXT_716441 [Caerostris extrusa]